MVSTGMPGGPREADELNDPMYRIWHDFLSGTYGAAPDLHGMPNPMLTFQISYLKTLLKQAQSLIESLDSSQLDALPYDWDSIFGLWFNPPLSQKAVRKFKKHSLKAYAHVLKAQLAILEDMQSTPRPNHEDPASNGKKQVIPVGVAGDEPPVNP